MKASFDSSGGNFALKPLWLRLWFTCRRNWSSSSFIPIVLKMTFYRTEFKGWLAYEFRSNRLFFLMCVSLTSDMYLSFILEHSGSLIGDSSSSSICPGWLWFLVPEHSVNSFYKFLPFGDSSSRITVMFSCWNGMHSSLLWFTLLSFAALCIEGRYLNGVSVYILTFAVLSTSRSLNS